MGDYKSYLVDYLDRITSKDKKGHYVCPFCGSGSNGHKNTSGLIINKDNTFHCHVCSKHGNIYTLVEYNENLHEPAERMKFLNNLYGDNGTGAEYQPKRTATKRGENMQDSEKIKQETKRDIEVWAQNIDKCDYLTKRGISIEIQKEYKIGYCEKWTSPRAQREGGKAFYSSRVIIPNSDFSYLARATDPKIEEYSKQNEGEKNLFNAAAAHQQDKNYMFVVEGEIDALSLIELGYKNVIGLGSVSQYTKLVNHLAEIGYKNIVLLCLDNDKVGKEYTEKTIKEFKTKRIRYIPYDIVGEYKDPNERLVKDRAGLKQALEKAEKDVQFAERVANEERKNQYMNKYRAVNFMGDFIKNISAQTTCIKTGSKDMDVFLEGGFYEGVYTLGAGTAAGKTSLCVQLADMVANNGNDVLYISLEMSKYELVARSISRITAQISKQENDNYTLAKDTRGITVQERWKDYTDKDKDVIQRAIAQYQDRIAPNMYLVEGVGNIGIDEIRAMVDKHITLTSRKPLLVIDYFQLLALPGKDVSDKQKADYNVMNLKRLTRDFKIPCLCISSLNRNSYNKTDKDVASFKESGGVEYTSDYCMILDFANLDESTDFKQEAKKMPRNMKIEFIKNRNGETYRYMNMLYYTPFNLFTQDKKQDSKIQGTVIKGRGKKFVMDNFK